ncbi:MAG: 16S rRNA (uracil(1498)-N(3))-methyltransferase [Flavobacteriales bacterium]|nr:16S rRNA (uracil(1498)-N(3))-methyltransferase [Flavobacteriales bacterium]
MQLFYTNHIVEGMAMLPEDESQHVIKVLRKRAGDVIYVTDGMGTLFEGTIYEAAAKEVRVNLEVLEKREKDMPDLTIAIAPTKNRDRFEWFIEKAVELGCTEIIPIWCDNSERKHARTDRWEKIAISAMKQSLHLYKPVIHPPTDVDDLFANAELDKDKMIAWLGEDEPSAFFSKAYDASKPSVIAIGPEGDFSDDEAELAKANGWTPVSLGHYRLRTETAGFTVVSWAAQKQFEVES